MRSQGHHHRLDTTVGGLYKVEHNRLTGYTTAAHKTLSIDEVHFRLGHISPCYIKELVVKGVITGIEVDKQSKPTFCTSCAKGKATRKAISNAQMGPWSTKFGKKTHTDVWGPTTPRSYDEHEYFITFMDDHTRWSRVDAMKYKSNALTCYKNYKAWAEMQHNVKLKQLQSDRGGEYLSTEFDQHLKSKGMIRKTESHPNRARMRDALHGRPPQVSLDRVHPTHGLAQEPHYDLPVGWQDTI
jgi:GAG-pre-integrase domain